MELREWVDKEMEKRGWSNSELARQMNVTSSAFSAVYTGKASASWEFCYRLSVALGKDHNEVFRMAGHLPPAKHDADTVKTLAEMMHRLSTEDLDLVEKYIEWRLFLDKNRTNV